MKTMINKLLAGLLFGVALLCIGCINNGHRIAQNVTPPTYPTLPKPTPIVAGQPAAAPTVVTGTGQQATVAPVSANPTDATRNLQRQFLTDKDGKLVFGSDGQPIMVGQQVIESQAMVYQNIQHGRLHLGETAVVAQNGGGLVVTGGGTGNAFGTANINATGNTGTNASSGNIAGGAGSGAAADADARYQRWLAGSGGTGAVGGVAHTYPTGQSADNDARYQRWVRGGR